MQTHLGGSYVDYEKIVMIGFLMGCNVMIHETHDNTARAHIHHIHKEVLCLQINVYENI